MKRIFRFAVLSALLAAFFTVGSVASFAQSNCEDYEGINELDAKIRENFGLLTTVKVAIDAGKQYLEKYGTCEATKDFVEWLKPQIPEWEKQYEAFQKEKLQKEILGRFDAAVKAGKWDEAYAAVKEFEKDFSGDPVYINLIVPLGQIGLLESAPPKKNYKYNAETLAYADKALELLRGGAKPTKSNGKYGVYQFEDAKDDVISNLIYAKAYIKYWVEGDKKTGITHYYEVSQLPGRNRSNPYVFDTIGGYYFEEVRKLADEIKTLVETQKAAEEDARKLEIEKEITAKDGLLKGYAERAMDAFARAYKFAQGEGITKEYRDGVYATIKTLYNIRFDKETGIEDYIATTVTKPMPDPSSEVSPIIEQDTSSAPSTTGSSAVNRL